MIVKHIVRKAEPIASIAFVKAAEPVSEVCNRFEKKNMFFETRLSQYLAEILNNLKEKIFTVQNGFTLVLFSLFTGFVFGNLFGTFLDMLSFYFVWNGFVGIFLILLIEIVNSLVYGTSLSIFCKKLYGNKRDNVSLCAPALLAAASHARRAPPIAQATHAQRVSSLTWYARKLKDLVSILWRISLTSFFKASSMMDDNSSSEQLSPITVTQTKYQGPVRATELLKLQTLVSRVQSTKPATAKKMKLLHPNILNCERSLNSFKIGLLFGFFVDSFKVGS